MIRDKMKLYEQFTDLEHLCRFCRKGEHYLRDCTKFHYLPDRDFLIKRMNFSAEQPRAVHPFRRRALKINALNECFKVQCACLKLNNLLEDEIEEEELSNNENSEAEGIRDMPFKFQRKRKSNVRAAARELLLKEKDRKRAISIGDGENGEPSYALQRKISFRKALSIVTFEEVNA